MSDTVRPPAPVTGPSGERPAGPERARRAPRAPVPPPEPEPPASADPKEGGIDVTA